MTFFLWLFPPLWPFLIALALFRRMEEMGDDSYWKD